MPRGKTPTLAQRHDAIVARQRLAEQRGWAGIGNYRGHGRRGGAQLRGCATRLGAGALQAPESGDKL